MLAIAAAPLALLFLLIAMDIDIEVPIEFDVVVPSIGSLILLTILFIFARLSLVLPAEAILRPRIRLTDSWRLTHSNTWRFAVGLFACGIAPGCLIKALLEWGRLVRSKMSPIEILITEGAPDTLIKGEIGYLILVASALTILPIGVGFLSHCYQQLARS